VETNEDGRCLKCGATAVGEEIEELAHQRRKRKLEVGQLRQQLLTKDDEILRRDRWIDLAIASVVVKAASGEHANRLLKTFAKESGHAPRAADEAAVKEGKYAKRKMS